MNSPGHLAGRMAGRAVARSVRPRRRVPHAGLNVLPETGNE
jgi:hypothetical protein